MNEQTNSQPEYEPPHVVDYGDLVELTAGHHHGHHEHGFPVIVPPHHQFGFSG